MDSSSRFYCAIWKKRCSQMVKTCIAYANSRCNSSWKSSQASEIQIYSKQGHSILDTLNGLSWKKDLKYKKCSLKPKKCKNYCSSEKFFHDDREKFYPIFGILIKSIAFACLALKKLFYLFFVVGFYFIIIIIIIIKTIIQLLIPIFRLQKSIFWLESILDAEI